MAERWSYEFAATKTTSESKAVLVFGSRAYFDRAISTLGDGEQVIVTVAKPVDKRSLQQNRALWGPIYSDLINGISKEEGIDLGDEKSKTYMHEGLLQRFSGTVIDPVTKCAVAKERSSAMTTARFCEFMEFVARFAAEEYGVVVTLPDER